MLNKGKHWGQKLAGLNANQRAEVVVWESVYREVAGEGKTRGRRKGAKRKPQQRRGRKKQSALTAGSSGLIAPAGEIAAGQIVGS